MNKCRLAIGSVYMSRGIAIELHVFRQCNSGRVHIPHTAIFIYHLLYTLIHNAHYQTASLSHNCCVQVTMFSPQGCDMKQ